MKPLLTNCLRYMSFDSFVNKISGTWGSVSSILSLSQEQSGGAYSSLGSKASDEIFLWQSDGIFSYSSHFSSLDLGHWSKSQGDKQVARKADGRIIILTYHLLVDITSVCAWRVLSARTYVICQYTQVHKIQRSLWQVMLPLEWPVLLSAVAHGSET